jgi:hypothetical protein
MKDINLGCILHNLGLFLPQKLANLRAISNHECAM